MMCFLLVLYQPMKQNLRLNNLRREQSIRYENSTDMVPWKFGDLPNFPVCSEIMNKKT